MRGDPHREAKTWLDKLTEVGVDRRAYQRLAAKGHITDEELDEALSELDETRKTAEHELAALHGRQERMEQMERDRDVILNEYARMAPEALDVLTSEERRQVYGMLRVRAMVRMDGALEVSGMFGEGNLFCPTEARYSMP